MMNAFFNLKKQPFTKERDSKEAFASGGFRELASRLDYLKNHRGFMLLTGEPGTGKTLGLRSFTDSLNTSFYFVVYLPLSTVSATEFYRQLNLALTGEFRHRKVDLFHSIQNTVKNLVTHQKKVPVLIFDEAHLLRTDNFYEIQILLNFEMDSTSPLLCILAGQPHLRDKVARPIHLSLNQRFTLKYHLPPLDKSETQAYLQHQLELCGGKPNPFSDSAVEALFQNTQGIPRQIDNLATKALTLAASRKNPRITEEEIFEASREL
jgi:type II secretory pathway predicted ATPase ExeA